MYFFCFYKFKVLKSLHQNVVLHILGRAKLISFTKEEVFFLHFEGTATGFLKYVRQTTLVMSIRVRLGPGKSRIT